MSLLQGLAVAEPGQTHENAEEKQHVAKDGDIVIIQEQYTQVKPLTLAKGKFFNNRFGRFSHNDIIDHGLGRRIYAQSVASSGRQSSRGFVHVLAPTPELWAMAMDHRTQIVYPHDSALIAFLLELRPGSVLVESGTGSGAACAAFARVIAPGMVYTFDFHKERADAARQDFQRLGLSKVVTVKGGVDVVKDGFIGVADAIADAVFLDLPVPYEMGDEVLRVLKHDGIVCMFSPCIEQVQRSCEILRAGGFHSFRTVTAPTRNYETREMKLETPGFDNLLSAQSPIVDPVLNSSTSDDEPVRKKARAVVPAPAPPLSEKKMRMRNRTAGAERLAIGTVNGQERHVGHVLRPSIRLHSRPFPSMKGHTSYLTFARKCSDFRKLAPSNDELDVRKEGLDATEQQHGEKPVIECKTL